MSVATPEALRLLLCELGVTIRDAVVAGRQGCDASQLSSVATHAGGDTIYAVDKFSEAAIIEWFQKSWPVDWPVQVVLEGIEHELCFPVSKTLAETQWKCIIDPIDGTRGIMY